MTPSAVQTRAGGDIIAPVGLGGGTGGAPVDLRAVAIEAIVRETDCSRKLAKRSIRWINGYVIQSREHGHRAVFPSQRRMNMREYTIFDSIMKHGTTSKPGSAHRAVEDALLDRSKGELTIMHDNQYGSGVARYCGVQVCTTAIR